MTTRCGARRATARCRLRVAFAGLSVAFAGLSAVGWVLAIEARGQRGDRRVERHPGGQRVGVGPVEFAESDAVEGHLRVVSGGLKFARRFGQRGAAALGLRLGHPCSSSWPEARARDQAGNPNPTRLSWPHVIEERYVPVVRVDRGPCPYPGDVLAP